MDLNVHVNCLYICKFVLFVECKSVMQVPVSGGKVSCKYKYRIVLFFIFACRELIFPPSGAFRLNFFVFLSNIIFLLLSPFGFSYDFLLSLGAAHFSHDAFGVLETVWRHHFVWHASASAKKIMPQDLCTGRFRNLLMNPIISLGDPTFILPLICFCWEKFSIENYKLFSET